MRMGRTGITIEPAQALQIKTRPRARFLLGMEPWLDQRPATTRTISSTLLE